VLHSSCQEARGPARSRGPRGERAARGLGGGGGDGGVGGARTNAGASGLTPVVFRRPAARNAETLGVRRGWSAVRPAMRAGWIAELPPKRFGSSAPFTMDEIHRRRDDDNCEGVWRSPVGRDVSDESTERCRGGNHLPAH
jgi:hypothetical protein